MLRPSKHHTWLRIAHELSFQSTCARRKVGCVLIDWNGQVLSTGWNGVASKFEHCIDLLCAGANLPSGTGLDLCEALHAEWNAIAQCKEVLSIQSCYVTASPCITCVKMLRNTGCRDIYFSEYYPHPDSERLWLTATEPGIKRTWNYVTKEELYL